MGWDELGNVGVKETFRRCPRCAHQADGVTNKCDYCGYPGGKKNYDKFVRRVTSHREKNGDEETSTSGNSYFWEYSGGQWIYRGDSRIKGITEKREGFWDAVSFDESGDASRSVFPSLEEAKEFIEE